MALWCLFGQTQVLWERALLKQGLRSVCPTRCGGGRERSPRLAAGCWGGAHASPGSAARGSPSGPGCSTWQPKHRPPAVQWCERGVTPEFQAGAGKALLKVAYFCVGLALRHGVGTPLRLSDWRICAEDVYGLYCPVGVILVRFVSEELQNR